MNPDRRDDLRRIEDALQRGAEALRRYAGGNVAFTLKDGHSPVTAADRELDALLRRLLPMPGDGWLSEETPDDPARLQCKRVWIVDPIDGTRSFVAGRPEYAISIALAEDGVPVLGGICNPAAGVTVLGGPGLGLRVDGVTAQPFAATTGDGLRVLCSRSEWRRGEWQRWQHATGAAVLPMGSVAYKLALVAAGAADATWTLQPKHEWDVAAGAALVRAAGGEVWLPTGESFLCNRPVHVLRSFAAARSGAVDSVRRLLA